jgi:hypothetical protein
MGIEPTRDLIGPTLVLKTRGNTSHQSPPVLLILIYMIRDKGGPINDQLLFAGQGFGNIEPVVLDTAIGIQHIHKDQAGQGQRIALCHAHQVFGA